MTKEALKLALEALHGFIPYLPLNDEVQCGRYDKAITAIKEALAQPEEKYQYGTPLLDAMTKDYVPPQRTWVGLTDEEIKDCFKITPDQHLPWHIYQRIEAKLKEKNT